MTIAENKADGGTPLEQIILDRILDGFILVDHHGAILDWNTQAEKILGWSKLDAIGRSLDDIIVTKNTKTTPHSSLINEISQFINQRVHISARHREGRDLEIELSIVSLAVDEVPQFGAFFRDITALAEAEKKLRIREEEYRSLVEHAADIIVIIDRDFKVQFINRLIGYTAAEVIGKSALTFIAVHDRDRIAAIYNSIFLTKEPCTYELEIIRSDGTRGWHNTHANPIFSGNNVVGITILTRDITEMKHAQEELKKNHEQLIISAKLSSLGEMAAGIAHEINNPLSIIYGVASQAHKKHLLGTLEHDKLSHDLQTILITTERIAKIVKGLRTFSRDATDDPMTSTPVSQVIDDTLELCKEKFRFHSIEIKTDCDPSIFIDCRPSQISQVLMNLLNNAYDAMETLPEKWVHLVVAKCDGGISISVTDSGSGIPSDIRGKVMQPFFTTKDIGKGTGLGLSISTGIVEGHGGKLFYDPSSPNTRFVLELPYPS